MNCFDTDPDRVPTSELDYTYNLYKNSNHTLPLVKMGCANSWLHSVNHSDKIIFLDEPHPSVIESYLSKVGFRGQLYRHALEICSVLSRKHGFHVLTFARENGTLIEEVWNEYDYLEKISVGNWIPFEALMNYYSRASLFFSYTHETYGFPCYENLQLGNAIIGYSDTHDPYVFKQYHNSVLLSLDMSIDMSAVLS